MNSEEQELNIKRALYHRHELHPDEAYQPYPQKQTAIVASEARGRLEATDKWMRKIAFENLMDDCYRAIWEAVDLKGAIGFEVDVYFKWERVVDDVVTELQKLGYKAWPKEIISGDSSGEAREMKIEIQIPFEDKPKKKFKEIREEMQEITKRKRRDE